MESSSSSFISFWSAKILILSEITENNKTIFEIQTFATSREQAKIIVDNWMHNADLIYPKLLEILANNDIEARN